MRIDYIPLLHSHQIFKDFSWPTTLSKFRRYNLILAGNGTGKTTLSNIFRALELRQPLGADAGDVRISVDGQVIRTSDFALNNPPNIRVFNRDSVDRTVHESNDQLPPVFYLGEENVEAQKRVTHLEHRAVTIAKAQIAARDAHDQAVRDFETFCTASAKAIKNLLTAPGGAYNTYDKARFKATCERILKAGSISSFQVPAKTRELLLAKRSAAPKGSIDFAQNFSSDLWELRRLTESLLKESVAASIIDSLAANPNVATWVSEGLPLHENETRCLFCNENLRPERLERLKLHFNDQFAIFTRRLKQQRIDLDRRVEQLSRALYPSATEFYEDEIPEYKLKLTAVRMANKQTDLYLKMLIGAIEEKQQRPFESLNFATVTGQMDIEHPILSLLLLATEALHNTLGGTAAKEMNGIISTHNLRASRHAEEVAAARKKLEETDVADSMPFYEKRI